MNEESPTPLDPTADDALAAASEATAPAAVTAPEIGRAHV